MSFIFKCFGILTLGIFIYWKGSLEVNSAELSMQKRNFIKINSDYFQSCRNYKKKTSNSSRKDKWLSCFLIGSSDNWSKYSECTAIPSIFEIKKHLFLLQRLLQQGALRKKVINPLRIQRSYLSLLLQY